MRRRYHYDPDLDAVVEIGGNYFKEAPRGPNVISDDIGAGVNGLRAMHRMDKRRFDSKSGMRKDAAEMGLKPVGDQIDFASTRDRPPRDYYGHQVNDAYQQIQGNWNGTADRLRRENEQRRK